jgi:lysophospholipid acyltransferase (LPLAT)-like uncharacterized protein
MHLPFEPVRVAPLIQFVDALLHRTTRCRIEYPEGILDAARGGEAVLFACRHGQLWPCLWTVRGTGTRVLVSNSSDGELLAHLLPAWGFSVARGSSSSSGMHGAREALRALRAGLPLGLAVDGPRGPRAAVQEGPLRLALRAGVPLVPLRVDGNGRWILRRTWDHFEVPRPAGRLCVHVGPRVEVDPGPTGLQEARRRLVQALEDPNEIGADHARVGSEGAQPWS